MKLTELIIRRPVSAVVIILAIVLFGFTSIMGMPQELTPEMNFPMLVIYTTYPNAAPRDVEKLVSNPIEGAVANLSGIDTVYSLSMENVSLVQIMYEYGTNMDRAFAAASERLDMISGQLPDDARKPIVIEIDINAMDTMTLSARSESDENLLQYIQDEIVPDFESLSTVAEISVSGGREEYIRVELLEDKLLQYGVSMNRIADALRTADFSMPSGIADYGSQSLNVRSSAQFRTINALENLPLSLGGGNIIRLSDVAVINYAIKDAESISRYNGEDNIQLGIQKRQLASAVSVSRQVRSVVDAINANDGRISIDIVNDNSDAIQDSIMSVGQTIILAVVLSMLVIFLFLGDIKASLIVGSSMPVSLLVTFSLMSLMGFTLNVVTMSAMVLGVGMMTDNAIVVLDACAKARGRDKTFADSAMEGTKFVLGAIIGSTISTVVVFLPLATLQGLSGQLFTPLGFTIVFALTASLFSAITLIPLFFVQFRPRQRERAIGNRMVQKLENAYAGLLRRILNRKVLATVVSILLIAGCAVLATQINMEMMPATDQGIVSISVETRPGLNLESIDEILLDLEALVKEHPDVERYTTRAGGGGSINNMSVSGGGANVNVYLKDDRRMSTNEVVELFREETRDWLNCVVSVSSQSMTAGMSSDDITINLTGKDFDVLRDFIGEIEDEVRKNPDVVTVTSSVAAPTPQAEIVVDSLKAAASGLTPMQVVSNVNAVLSGTQAAQLSMENDKTYNVRVEYPAGKYTSVADLSNLMLMSPAGTSVPLMDIADIVFTDVPQTILRKDNQYNVSVTVTPRQAVRFETAADVNQRVANMAFPQNVALGTDEQTEMMMEEFLSLGGAILAGIWLIFMVMAIQFESIKHALMVMICIPFSMIGAVALMYLTGTTLSMTSLLGFLVLVAIVVNNGILYVDGTNKYRKSMDLTTALIYTGRNRLRPIMMTTITTILSVMPMMFATGNAAMMQGLAMVIVGGLTVSTILTLLLLPTFYLLIEGGEEKKRKREEKRRIKWQKAQEKEFGAFDEPSPAGDPPVIQGPPPEQIPALPPEPPLEPPSEQQPEKAPEQTELEPAPDEHGPDEEES